MKTKQEIDELAINYADGYSMEEAHASYIAFQDGYNQCQEDMTRKEIQPEGIWNKESQDKIKEHILNHVNKQSSEDILET